MKSIAGVTGIQVLPIAEDAGYPCATRSGVTAELSGDFLSAGIFMGVC